MNPFKVSPSAGREPGAGTAARWPAPGTGPRGWRGAVGKPGSEACTPCRELAVAWSVPGRASPGWPGSPAGVYSSRMGRSLDYRGGCVELVVRPGGGHASSRRGRSWAAHAGGITAVGCCPAPPASVHTVQAGVARTAPPQTNAAAWVQEQQPDPPAPSVSAPVPATILHSPGRRGTLRMAMSRGRGCQLDRHGEAMWCISSRSLPLQSGAGGGQHTLPGECLASRVMLVETRRPRNTAMRPAGAATRTRRSAGPGRRISAAPGSG